MNEKYKSVLSLSGLQRKLDQSLRAQAEKPIFKLMAYCNKGISITSKKNYSPYVWTLFFLYWIVINNACKTHFQEIGNQPE